MKVNKFNDERLQKNLEQAAASMYPVILILTAAVLVVKIVLNLHHVVYLFEIMSIILSLSYYVISTAWKNVLYVNRTDEAVINIRRTTKFRCYWIHTFISLFMPLIFWGVGHYFYPLFFEAQGVLVLLNVVIYIFVCGLPLGFAGDKMKKKGDLLVWNSEKSKTRVLKTLKWALLCQTICNVVLNVVMYFLSDSASLFDVLVLFVIMQFLWIFMYFQIRRNLLINEKNAIKEVERVEKSVDVETGGCEE
jgi:hypothetical protein